jgi:hypothetical protein
MKVEVNLVAEKTIKEQMDEAMKTGHGVIIPTFNVLNGTMSDDKTDTFDISRGGDTKLYFTFGKGKRRVNVDISPLLIEAYMLAIEE